MTGKPRPFRRLPQACHEHGAPTVTGPELSSSPPYGLLATTIVRRMSPRRTASIMLRRRPSS